MSDFLKQHGLYMGVRYKGLQLYPQKCKIWRVIIRRADDTAADRRCDKHRNTLMRSGPPCSECNKSRGMMQRSISLNFRDHEPTPEALLFHLSNLLVMSHLEDHDEASGIAKRIRRFFTQREIDELTKVTFLEEPTDAENQR